MKYKVFTDGTMSQQKRLLGMAYVIVTNDKYIKMNQFSTKGASATKAEVIAVGLACEYMLKNLNFVAGDSVTFYVDSKNAASYLTGECSNILSSENDDRVENSLNNFRVLQHGVDVSIKKVWAHGNTGLHGNKLADRLVNYALVAD